MCTWNQIGQYVKHRDQKSQGCSMQEQFALASTGQLRRPMKMTTKSVANNQVSLKIKHGASQDICSVIKKQGGLNHTNQFGNSQGTSMEHECMY